MEEALVYAIAIVLIVGLFTVSIAGALALEDYLRVLCMWPGACQ